MNISAPEKLTWNLEEASQATGIGSVTLRRVVADGKLKANKVGRRLLIPDEELRRYVGAAARVSDESSGTLDDAA